MDHQAPGATTGGVRLREVTEADLPIFFAHQQDPDAIRMAAFAARDRPTFMAHWAQILADENVIVRTILVDEQVAGNIVSWSQLGEHEVGYWLGREYWGRGVATQALTAFLEHLPTRPLFARVAQHNIGSRRVLEKCGFVVIGEDRIFADANGEEIAEFVLILRAPASASAP